MPAYHGTVRYRRYSLNQKGPSSVSVLSTGPYFSFLTWVGIVLAPLFAVAMLWEFWASMFDWHFGSGGIFLMIYTFLGAVLVSRLSDEVGRTVGPILCGLLAAPLLILSGGLYRA